MIKAAILDVDGVIVGDQPEVNMPLPHREVIERFRSVGVPIVLCTAKFGPAIREIAVGAELNNPHITDNGAVSTNFIEGRVIKQHTIGEEAVSSCIRLCLERGMPVEAYTATEYYSQELRRVGGLAEKRGSIVQQEPIQVESLEEVAAGLDVIKLIAFADPANKETVDIGQVLDRQEGVSYIWTQHPYLNPIRPLVITASGVSKAAAAKEVLESMDVSFADVLGVGDTGSDWGFMQFCGYVATLANGDAEIKQLIRSNGEGRHFTAPHVNDNGVLDILDYFGL